MYAKSHALVSPSLSTDIYNLLLTPGLVKKSDICFQSRRLLKSTFLPTHLSSILPLRKVSVDLEAEHETKQDRSMDHLPAAPSPFFLTTRSKDRLGRNPERHEHRRPPFLIPPHFARSRSVKATYRRAVDIGKCPLSYSAVRARVRKSSRQEVELYRYTSLTKQK